jgi:hypothetical protein
MSSDTLERKLAHANARILELETKLAAASQAYDCTMAIDGTVLEDLVTDRKRLDWLLLNPIRFEPVQIPCPDGRPGCLVFHCRPRTSAECRSVIDAAMEGKL